jgi:hypothetical protein
MGPKNTINKGVRVTHTLDIKKGNHLPEGK